MVKLYTFNKNKDRWEFVRFGYQELAKIYASEGYYVIHI